MRHRARVAALCALSSLVLAAAGCDAPGRRPPSPSAPVLVLAVDGLEASVLVPLLTDGELPHLSGLVERGRSGLLETLRPTASPIIWTSIATGKGPDAHGIHHFARRTKQGLRLYHNGDRRTKALWNIASDHGLRSAVVGWWMTYPVEPLEGVMVAQTNTLAQLDTRGGRHVWKGALRRGMAGQVHPAERQAEMLEHLEATEATLDGRVESIFGRFPHPMSRLGETLWRNCRWAFRADSTYLAIMRHLIASDPAFDLMMLYLGGPDVVGHRFWRYMDPASFRHPPPPEQVENFAGVIPDYYRFVDRALGELLATLPAKTNVIVVSDHGMHAVRTGARFDPDHPPEDVNSGEHQDAPPGVLMAAGPGIRRARVEEGGGDPSRSFSRPIGHVYDVAPTVLALLEIPVGRDMAGGILEGLLREPDRARPDFVATHDSEEFVASRPRVLPQRPDEQERLDQLRALGYLRETR